MPPSVPRRALWAAGVKQEPEENFLGNCVLLPEIRLFTSGSSATWRNFLEVLVAQSIFWPCTAYMSTQLNTVQKVHTVKTLSRFHAAHLHIEEEQVPWVSWFKYFGIGLDQQASFQGMWNDAYEKGERAFAAFASAVLAISFRCTARSECQRLFTASSYWGTTLPQLATTAGRQAGGEAVEAITGT